MQFLHFLTLISCAITIQVAGVQTVRDDIASITTLMASLASDVKLVKPGSAGIAQALQVQVDAVDIHKRLVTSINDAEASDPFGTAGSLSIGLDFIGLAPKVKTTLQDVSKQKSALGELGIVVMSSLYQLKQDTADFGAAVLEKLDALTRGIAPVIIKDLDNAFNDAIVSYGGKAV